MTPARPPDIPDRRYTQQDQRLDKKVSSEADPYYTSEAHDSIGLPLRGKHATSDRK